MAKVAYSEGYGGLALSLKAILLGCEMSGNPNWAGLKLRENMYRARLPDHFPRHDPILIAIIEKLGDEANCHFSKLKLIEIPSGTRYRVVKHDGWETVETPDSHDWVVAP